MASAHVMCADVALAEASHGGAQRQWGRKQTQSQRGKEDLFSNNLHYHIDVP